MPFIYAVGCPGNAASGKPDPVYKKQHAGGYEGGFRQNSTIKRNKEKKVIIKHVLRNSLIPVVTYLGMEIPLLIGGAVVTEQVFSWPGIGSLMIKSIDARDYPVVMGITVLVAIAVLVFNILTDLVYGILDPRIRYN